MKFNTMYEKMIESQDEARRGLKIAIQLEPNPMYKLEEIIGIDRRTIKRFLEGKDCELLQYMRICRYIEDVEKRHQKDV